MPTQSFMSLPLWGYILLWFFFGYVFILLLGFNTTVTTNPIIIGMYLVNFGVHEASHLIVFFLPAIFVALAGSVGEMAFTILLLTAAIKARSYFGAVFAGLWVMLGCMSVGRYIADARAQSLPLVGPGDMLQHDWHYILLQLGWLQADTFIGGSLQMVGICIGALSLVAGLWLMYMKVTRRTISRVG